MRTLSPPLIPLTFSTMTVESDEDALWVRAARGGDRDAFARLVVKYQGRVFRLASRFFRHREDVEEAAQETFLTAWRKLDRYSGRAPFEHWLTRVCLNTSLTLLRKRPTNVALEREVSTTSNGTEAKLDAARLIAQLSPADAMVLKLMYAEGWSVAEVADRMGWSQANVKVRAHRARRKLRRTVEEDMRRTSNQTGNQQTGNQQTGNHQTKNQRTGGQRTGGQRTGSQKSGDQ